MLSLKPDSIKTVKGSDCGSTHGSLANRWLSSKFRFELEGVNSNGSRRLVF
ncbi:MAG: hypothetical protein RJA70_1396 [Pseudomonadota bacterium]|jgi:hypothetical protein